MQLSKPLSLGLAALILIPAIGAFYMHSELVYPAAKSQALAPTKVIHKFEKGSFPENILIDKAGTIYVSLLSPKGGVKASKVWMRTKDGHERILTGTGNNLAMNSKGQIYVTAMDGDPQKHDTIAVRLDRLTDSGFENVTTFPKGAMINGLAFDSTDNLYAADSLSGIIWRVGIDGKLVKWFEDNALKPASLPGIPGANGLRIKEAQLYVVNSSSGNFYRLSLKNPILELVAKGVPGDGFAIDGEDYYVTTHPYNSIVRIDKSGHQTVIGNQQNGIVGPSDAQVLGRSLYVVQDGGAFADLIPPFARWLFPKERTDPALISIKLR
jgi:hypothetical protein